MFNLNYGAELRALFAAVLLMFAATIAYGQVDTGTVLGVVTDATGSSVVGASVQVQNTDTGFSRTEQTDANGRYQIQSLPLGAYSVTIQQQGFKTEERRGVTLSVGAQVAVNVQLTVGNASEKVEVTAEAAAVETTNATVSQLTTGEQVRDLPLNGRSMEELAGLTPGMYVDRTGTPNASVGFGARMSINGAQPDMMLFLLDGTVMNDPSGGAPISAARGMLGVEGILEFRMLTHTFSAEYGRVGGGVMSMVTRSGSNDFHGSAYEFIRNNALDARNFFNQDPLTHGALPAYRRNQFGGSVGGRIIKDKLFFFGNYEGLRQVQGNPINIPVPDQNARNGFLPCASVPTQPCNAATGLAPGAAANVLSATLPFVNLYPAPNGAPIGGGTSQYLSTFFARSSENYTMARMDYRISDKDNFYGRYVENPANLNVPRPVPIWGELDQSNPHYALLSETHIFSSRSLNEFRAAFNRVNQRADAVTYGNVDPNVTLIPGQGLAQIQFSSLVASGGQLPALGTNFGRPQSYPQNIFQESDTFSTVRGAHSLKFGIDVERVQINLNQLSGNTRGSETFGGLTDLMAGKPSSITLVLANPSNKFERGNRRTIIGWFVHDDYRLRPNLTMNIGLRQDIFTTPTEVNGLMGQLVNLTDAVETPGKPFISNKNTYSPRIGIAWDPFGDGKTSVRAGGGIYYSPVDGRPYYQASLGGNLWLNSVKINNPNFPNPLLGVTNLTPALPSITAIQYNLQNPTHINYNLEVQRQLTRDLTLKVAYVGSVNYHILRTVSYDTRTPTTLANGQTFYPTNTPFLNPNFSAILYEPSDGRANYNGLQTNLTKRLSAGFQVNAAFTYSKAMSNTDQAIANTTIYTPSSTMNPLNLAQDYAESVYSERYHLTLNGSYALPFGKSLNSGLAKKLAAGWTVNGIYAYGSGHPQTILDGFNNANTNDSNNPDRPNLNPGFSGNLNSGTTAGCSGIAAGALHRPERWFDPCAFSLPIAGTFGNLGRDTVFAPGLNNVDFALVKDTAITERLKLQFRGEIFNILNHAQFGVPNNTVFTSSRVYSSSAGQITTTSTDSREIQFGLKLIF